MKSLPVDDLHPFQPLGMAVAVIDDVADPDGLDLLREPVADRAVDLRVVLAGVPDEDEPAVRKVADDPADLPELLLRGGIAVGKVGEILP